VSYFSFIVSVILGVWGSIVVKALRYLVGGSRNRFLVMSLGTFFRGSSRRNHVPWGRLSLENDYQGFLLG